MSEKLTGTTVVVVLLFANILVMFVVGVEIKTPNSILFNVLSFILRE